MAQNIKRFSDVPVIPKVKALGSFWDTVTGAINGALVNFPVIGPAVALYDAYGQLTGANDPNTGQSVGYVSNGTFFAAPVGQVPRALGPVDQVAMGISQGASAVGTGIGDGLKYAIVGLSIIAGLYAVYNIEAAKRL